MPGPFARGIVVCQPDSSNIVHMHLHREFDLNLHALQSCNTNCSSHTTSETPIYSVSMLDKTMLFIPRLFQNWYPTEVDNESKDTDSDTLISSPICAT